MQLLPMQKHCLWLCQHVDLLLCYSPHTNHDSNTHIPNQPPAPHTTRLPSGHAAMQKPRVLLRQHAHCFYATAVTPTQTATHTPTPHTSYQLHATRLPHNRMVMRKPRVRLRQHAHMLLRYRLYTNPALGATPRKQHVPCITRVLNNHV